jgi:hypothetical protein
VIQPTISTWQITHDNTAAWHVEDYCNGRRE